MKYFVFFLFITISINSFSQVDSLVNSIPETIQPQKQVVVKPKFKKTDSLKTQIIAIVDSLKTNTTTDSIVLLKSDSIIEIKKEISYYNLLINHPILNYAETKVLIPNFKKNYDKDYLFYLLAGIVFLLAIVQFFFKKYFNNVFNIFFQTNFRQLQTREQLTQDNVAALLLNFLFILSASTFVTLISDQAKIINKSFWQIFYLSFAVLSIIYLIKLGFIQFMGWIFNTREISKSYSFIVFIVNKIIGVTLIPILLLLAFSTLYIQQLALSTSLILISFLFLFRFFSVYKLLSERLKINAIHFFLYFCSIEILPLLIMYKALGNYINNGI